MTTAGYIAMSVSYLGFLAVKFNGLRRDPRNPFLWSVCAVLALAGLGSCARIPVVATTLETRSGVMAVWLLVPITLGCAATRTVLLLWAHPLPEAAPKIRTGLVFYAIATAAIITLTVAARGSVTPAEIISHQQEPDQLWASTPHVRDAYLICAAAIGYTWTEGAVRTVAWIRLADRRWLRRGLRTLLAGFLLFDLFTAAWAGFAISVRVGAEAPKLLAVDQLAAVLAAVVSVTGIALPLFGPRWDRMLAYHRLESLWAPIHQALPYVSLERHWAIRLNRWNPWGSDFRVYRRVIEIRDGLLGLPAYVDPQVGVVARRLAEAAHQSGSELETTVLAAQLHTAIRNKRNGRPPHQQKAAESPLLLGGGDLDSELSLLLPLARALTTSPIVKAAADEAITAEASTGPAKLASVPPVAT